MPSQLVQSDSALAALAAATADPLMLLHSGRPHPRWAVRSLLAQPAAWFRYTADHRSHLTGLDRPLTHNLWRDLRSLLNDPTLPGRWFGYFSYDLASLIEPAKLTPVHPNDWPLVQLAYCPHTREFPPGNPPTKPRDERSDAAMRSGFAEHGAPDAFTSNLPQHAYESAVRRALQYIAAGDIFQVNLAQTFTTQFTGSPRALYHRLAALSPAWYGAYMELPHLAAGLAPRVPPPRAIRSTSPELFLHVKNNHITTRPIKGTRPALPPRRGDLSPPVSDLLTSEKDRAELNMIIDLMRNDLGRVSTYGSIRVTDPRALESHPTIDHTTATIEADLHPSRDIVDLLRATLPGGSITGAPKIRAMQIIHELEPNPRGPYTGCLGYIAKDELHLNIAIRTILLTPANPNAQRSDAAMCSGFAKQGAPDSPTYRAAFSTGAGIVADSNPTAEYHETLTKAAPLMQALTV
ncbi:MAG: aminodeoxychorismate synthase, component I [Planctomycetes bacterium]|nr:aminodeoxychorismate synthase, component I [Planctomycetota bacterium]